MDGHKRETIDGTRAIMHQSVLARMVKLRILGKSPAGAYLRLNEWIWNHLPHSLTTLPPLRAHGNILHSLVRTSIARRQYFGTYIFRKRTHMELIRRLSNIMTIGSTLTMAFL